MKKLSADLKQFIPYVILAIASLYGVVPKADMFGSLVRTAIVPVVVIGMAFGLIWTLLSKPSRIANSLMAVYSLLAGSLIMFFADSTRIKTLFIDQKTYVKTLNPLLGEYNQFFHISRFLLGALIVIVIVATIKAIIKRVKPSFKPLHMLFVLVPILVCYLDGFIAVNSLRVGQELFITSISTYIVIAIISMLFVSPTLSQKMAVILLIISFVLSPLFASGFATIFKMSVPFISPMIFIKSIVNGAIFGVALKSVIANIMVAVKAKAKTAKVARVAY